MRMIIEFLFIIAGSKVLLEVEWVNKMCYINTMEHFIAMKKRMLIGAARLLNFKDIMLRKRSKTQKSTHYMIQFI